MKTVPILAIKFSRGIVSAFQQNAFQQNAFQSVFNDFFSTFEQEFTFEGDTYLPLDFAVTGRKVTTSMELPRFQLVASNVADKVIDWIEDNDILIRRNKVILLNLTIDEALTVAREEPDLNLRLELVSSDDRAATFQLGYSLGLDDKIPRETMELDEYPMLRADFIPVAVG